MPDERPVVQEATQQALCQEVLGYQFQNLAFLARGSDARLRRQSSPGFQRAARIPGRRDPGAVVCDLLYHRYPEALEGELTRIKSFVVSRRTCARLSRKLGLEEFLILGKGMGGHRQTPPSVLADVFEGLIGAIYLDGGLEPAKRSSPGRSSPRSAPPSTAKAAPTTRASSSKSPNGN